MNILLLPQSFVGESYEILKVVPDRTLDNPIFWFFNGFEVTARAIGATQNYEQFKSLLAAKGLPFRTLEQYSLDEFFVQNAAHTEKDVYLISPAVGVRDIVVASAAVTGYNGKLYLMGNTFSSVERNLTAFINDFKARPSHGHKMNDDSLGQPGKFEECHFYVDGKLHDGTLGTDIEDVCDGAEGYTFLFKKYPQYRVKIWSDPKSYHIEKTASLINGNYEHTDIAFPIAFVYNSAKQAIGYIMPNYTEDFDELTDRALIRLPVETRLIILQQMLVAFLHLESITVLHKDIHHNMLFSPQRKDFKIIDMESTQYRSSFATAAAANKDFSIAPTRFKSNSFFYNTVDLSYVAFRFLCTAFLPGNHIYGPCKEHDKYIKRDTLGHLDAYCPSLANMIREAYLHASPISLTRQLIWVEQMLDNLPNIPTVVEPTPTPPAPPSPKPKKKSELGPWQRWLLSVFRSGTVPYPYDETAEYEKLKKELLSKFWRTLLVIGGIALAFWIFFILLDIL